MSRKDLLPYDEILLFVDHLRGEISLNISEGGKLEQVIKHTGGYTYFRDLR